ncbi:MAG TPA: ABC transporter permease [Methanospirillum sp.]|nr:ABC transporter permease [Methanospirillum sp.]
MSSHYLYFHLALRNVRLHWLRSLLAVIGIVIGVLAISLMGILGTALQISTSESLLKTGDTIIITPHTESGSRSGPESTTILDDRQIEKIRRAATGSQVIPFYQTTIRYIVKRDAKYATIMGVESKYISGIFDIETGLPMRSMGGVMVGAELAKQENLKIGSRILLGDTENQVKVSGIFKKGAGTFGLDADNIIVASDLWFKNTYEVKGYDAAIVKVKTINDIEKTNAAIEAQLNQRKKTVDLYDGRALMQNLISAFGQITTFVMAIGGISLIVAGVSIFNVMMMSVMERYKEIGILRSIGTRRSGIWSMFLYEAIILGLSGGIAGGLFSLGIGYVLLRVLLEKGDYIFRPEILSQLPYGMAFGLMTCLISGIYPAFKAARLCPIEALRHN